MCTRRSFALILLLAAFLVTAFVPPYGRADGVDAPAAPGLAPSAASAFLAISEVSQTLWRDSVRAGGAKPSPSALILAMGMSLESKHALKPDSIALQLVVVDPAGATPSDTGHPAPDCVFATPNRDAGQVAFEAVFETVTESPVWTTVDRAEGVAQTIAISIRAGFASGGVLPPTPVVVLVLDVTLDLTDAPSNPAPGLVDTATMTAVMPLHLSGSIDEASAIANDLAEEVLEDLAAFASGSIYSCISPWVGFDDIQCCALYSAYQATRGACFAKFFGGIASCVKDGGIAWATCFFPCLAVLIATGALDAPICANLCAIFGVFTIGLCIFDEAFELRACLLQATATAIDTLTSNGCWPPPDAFPIP